MSAPRPPSDPSPSWPPPSLPVPAGSTAVPSRPPRDRAESRRGWLLLAVFAVAEVTFLAASLLVLLPFAIEARDLASGKPLPPLALVTALVVPTVLAAVVAIIGAALAGRGGLGERLRDELALRWRGRDVVIGLSVGLASLILTLPAAALWAYLVGEDQASSAVGEVFDGQRLSLGIALTLFFAVWLIAPFCEEVLYRGVLWRAMEHWGWNRWVILALTTLAFSVAHLEPSRTSLLLVISIPIALARLFTGNLLASIVAHQANNLLPAIGLLLISQGVMPA